MVQSLCGNPVVQKCPVVLLWYPCCTSEYHRNYHRNEKYGNPVVHVSFKISCGNSVVLLWYPCCTSEYHRNEKYFTQVLW